MNSHIWLSDAQCECTLRLDPAYWNLPTRRACSFELIKSGLRVEAQKPLSLVYESVKLECGYRVDLLVEGKLIIEVKAVEALAEIHFAQVLTYLRLSNLRLALLLNFNVVHMKDGIRRIVNKL
jgi:GxxExxY protein